MNLKKVLVWSFKWDFQNRWECRSRNKSKSLAEEVFVDLFEYALLKRTSSLVSERAALGDKSGRSSESPGMVWDSQSFAESLEVILWDMFSA